MASDSSDDDYPPFRKFTGPPPGKEYCGFEWQLWRETYERLAGPKMRKLSDGMAKHKAYTLMTGRAKEMTRYIEIGPNDGPNKVSLETFLDRLEGVFSPPPGKLMAQNEFENETQQTQLGEDVDGKIGDLQIYKNRLHFLWKRAYPDSGEDHSILVFKFIRGLADATVRERVQEQNPSTLSEALDLAQRVTADIEIMRNAA